MTRYLLLLMMFGISCTPPAEPINTSRTPDPRPAERAQALNDYLTKKGWRLIGMDDTACSPDTVCLLEVSNGKENKIVRVVIRQFYHPDGTAYWGVYNPTQTELIQGQIDDALDARTEP